MKILQVGRGTLLEVFGLVYLIKAGGGRRAVLFFRAIIQYTRNIIGGLVRGYSLQQ